jgi:outer membrane protein assembly factor BamB
MDKLQMAEQFRKAMQFFTQTLGDEEAMEIATVYPAYEVGKAYKEKELFTYGVNGVGDPHLYRVVQAHTSQEDWKPDTTPSLYTPIGLDDDGYPIWAQPTGAHDAYNKGDIVDYNGTLYVSTMDGNTYSPDAYPAGWELYEK